MFILTETTPNPATLKFIPGRAVMGEGTAQFATAEAAEGRSPMAQRLFGVPGVTGVFLGGDFISVTKDGTQDWFQLKPSILGAIMEHYTSGRPIVLEQAKPESGDGEADSETVAAIKELIETRVRPAVAQDGGDIIFEHFEDGVVYLQMHGACSGCPSSTATLKAGIENMLRHYIPEVVEVRAL
jgi:Fe-S cluster biogenesis protein NfuA